MILARKNEYYPTFNSVFDNIFGLEESNLGTYKPNISKVAVNIKEFENEFILELAAPGFSKNEFAIKVENKILNISAKKEDKKEEREGKITRREFNYQSFEKNFSLQDGIVDSEKIGASYENGILKLTLPKTDLAKPKPVKEISIN